MSTWLTIIAAGLVTYATRLSSIMLYDKLEMPALVQRSLRFVPVAVLTAIFFPDLIYLQDELVLSFQNPRLLAGILAIFIAWRTKNVIYTIVAGMLSLWMLQLIIR
jgi:branched-subunit amino acid transport protein